MVSRDSEARSCVRCDGQRRAGMLHWRGVAHRRINRDGGSVIAEGWLFQKPADRFNVFGKPLVAALNRSPTESSARGKVAWVATCPKANGQSSVRKVINRDGLLGNDGWVPMIHGAHVRPDAHARGAKRQGGQNNPAVVARERVGARTGTAPEMIPDVEGVVP
jgi:hypothetical protein